MAKFKVISPIEHNLKRYEPESEIELPEALAAPLLEVGVIEKLEKKSNDDNSASGKTAADDANNPGLIAGAIKSIKNAVSG